MRKYLRCLPSDTVNRRQPKARAMKTTSACLSVALLTAACTQPCPPAPAPHTPAWVMWGYVPNRYAPTKAYTGNFAQSECEGAIAPTQKSNPNWSFVCLPENVSPYGGLR
jgi:hypothetical protein